MQHGEAIFTALEHEAMHQETLLYMWHRLPHEHKHKPVDLALRARRRAGRRSRTVRIPAGAATLGADRAAASRSAGTTSSAQVRVDVPAFDIDVHNVTNAEYLEFVAAGGYRRRESLVRRGLGLASQSEASSIPIFWVRRRRGVALARHVRGPAAAAAWPVYVSQAEARAFARWQGRRLPTEAGVPPRRVRDAGGRRAAVPVGRCAARRAARQLRFPELGTGAGRLTPGRRERVGRARSRRATAGSGRPRSSAVPRLQPDGVVSGVLGGLLRRPALRDEGRLAPRRPGSWCARASATGSGPITRTSTRRSEPPAAAVAHGSSSTVRCSREFAADVRRDLALDPKQLQSKYLYDALGSSLFEAICRLPWYRITARREPAPLAQHADGRSSRHARRRGHDRRAGVRQWREAGAARRGAAGARRRRRACT